MAAARDNALHAAAAARASGDESAAERFDAVAREAEQRMRRVHAIRDSLESADWFD